MQRCDNWMWLPVFENWDKKKILGVEVWRFQDLEGGGGVENWCKGLQRVVFEDELS